MDPTSQKAKEIFSSLAGKVPVSGDRSVVTIVWDLDTRKPIRRLTHPDCRDYPRCCRFSPDGAQIAVGNSDKLIRLWDARTGDLMRTFAGHDDDIEDIAFHPTGAMLASCDRAGVIRTWPLDTTGQLFQGDTSWTTPLLFVVPPLGGFRRSPLTKAELQTTWAKRSRPAND